MSTPSDHMDEMPNDTLTDEAIEAFFLGLPDPGWEHEASLATLTDDVALVMSGPAPVADHALLRFFWGAPAAQAEPAPSAAPTWGDRVTGVGGGVRTVGAFRGRLRLVAGAALGTALALFGVGVAGATGALPDPAQRVVARVVEAVSPFELPQPQSHPGGPSGGGAATITDSNGRQVPTTAQQPGVTAPGAASNGPETTSTPNSVPPTGPGATGLDRAGQTPAGQAIPSSVPGVGPPGNQPPANQPPAANNGKAAATGLDRAGQTPAATAVPSSVPGPPGGVPVQRGR